MRVVSIDKHGASGRERPTSLRLNAGCGDVCVRPTTQSISPDEILIRSDAVNVIESRLLQMHRLSLDGVLEEVQAFNGRWGGPAADVLVHPRFFADLVAMAEELFLPARIPAHLHAASGRPFLFVVQRSWALDSGNGHLLAEIDRAIELWERSPEEWEYERVEPFHWGPVRLSLPMLESLAHAGPAQWPYVGGQRIDPRAILSCRSWPEMVRFFGQLQIDVAQLPNRLEYELRPTSELTARNNAAHFPTYAPLPRGR